MHSLAYTTWQCTKRISLSGDSSQRFQCISHSNIVRMLPREYVYEVSSRWVVWRSCHLFMLWSMVWSTWKGHHFHRVLIPLNLCDFCACCFLFLLLQHYCLYYHKLTQWERNLKHMYVSSIGEQICFLHFANIMIFVKNCYMHVMKFPFHFIAKR